MTQAPAYAAPEDAGTPDEGPEPPGPGEIDLRFGENGIASPAALAGLRVEAGAVNGMGRLVLVGSVDAAGGREAAVARLGRTGVIDASFGTGRLGHGKWVSRRGRVGDRAGPRQLATPLNGDQERDRRGCGGRLSLDRSTFSRPRRLKS